MAYYKFGAYEWVARLPTLAQDTKEFALTDPTVVYYSGPRYPDDHFRLLSPGAYDCAGANIGTGGHVSSFCYRGPVKAVNDVAVAVGRPGGVSIKKNEGDPFQLDQPATIWYGVDQALSTTPWHGTNVPTGTYICGTQQFGPDPAYGKAKKCWIVPNLAPKAGSVPITFFDRQASQSEVEDASVIAKQAQQNAYQAQLALQQQNADAAQESARLAENALAQQASAQKSAEAYRQIMEQASAQATAIAVELAKIAAENAEDEDARRAAAEVAIEAENIRQATEKAKSDAAKANQGYLIAQQMTLEELAKQREAAAKVNAAEDAAYADAEARRQAALGTGGGGGISGMSTTTMLLYGGLALAALLLVTD
jgi:DNA segregation ATPase FtsK/SpoIIIE-like protein